MLDLLEDGAEWLAETMDAKTTTITIHKPGTPVTRNAFGEVTTATTAAGAAVLAEVYAELVTEQQDAGRIVGHQRFTVRLNTPAYPIAVGHLVVVGSGTYSGRTLHVDAIAPPVAGETVLQCHEGGV